MKKFLVLLPALLPIFAIAACGNLEFVLGTSANANVGGAGGSSGGNGGDTLIPGKRLTPLLFNGSDGTRVFSGSFHDSELETDCKFQSMPNGETRCVPDHVAMNTFIDAECKIPVFAARYDSNSECPTTFPVFGRFDYRDGDGCSANPIKFRIAAPNLNDPQSITKWYSFNEYKRMCVSVSGNGGNDIVAYSAVLLGTNDDFVFSE